MLADEPLLSTSQVAGLIQVSQHSIVRWILAGRLKAIRLPNRQYRVRLSDAEAILANDAVESSVA